MKQASWLWIACTFGSALALSACTLDDDGGSESAAMSGAGCSGFSIAGERPRAE